MASNSNNGDRVVRVRLIPEESFTLLVGDDKLTGFRVVSEWEGMRKLEDARGRVMIIMMSDLLFNPIAETLSRITGDSVEYVVVAASAELGLQRKRADSPPAEEVERSDVGREYTRRCR